MRILIVRNQYNSEATEASLLLEMYLQSQGIECETYCSEEVKFSNAIIDQNIPSPIDRFDMAVVLGGDGTILRTAAQIAWRRIPILCTNFGHLGFMANSNADGVVTIMAAALAGEISHEERTNMRIDVYCHNEGSLEDPFGTELPPEPDHSYFALNEVALTRGDGGRVIDYAYAVQGDPVATLRGDGLVIATATGSTAYALSVGGPLVTPSFGGLVVAPIAPHTLQSRALLTGASDVIEVALHPSSANREATMFIDGEKVAIDDPISRVVVRPGPDPTVLLRYDDKSFYTLVSEVFFSASN